MADLPFIARLHLGRELRRLREGAVVSRDAAADELECTLSKISKVEAGNANLRPAEIRLLLDLYGVTERHEVHRLGREARRRSTARVPDWARKYLGLEADATELRTYQAELVPGLLQTEAYARTVTRAADLTQDPREVERMVATRLGRQQRLTGDSPPLFWAIVNEAVIRREVGGQAVLAGQLEHLLAMAEHDHITVQVLPFAAGAHGAMGSSFVHLRLLDPPDGELVYLEDLAGSDYVDGRTKVADYLARFGMLATAALDADESAALIRDAAGEFR